MKIVIIPQKRSNSGSIYDIESSLEDIELRFRKNERFAVVLPSHYNVRPTYARNEAAAVAKAEKLSREGYRGVVFVGSGGGLYRSYYGALRRDFEKTYPVKEGK